MFSLNLCNNLNSVILTKNVRSIGEQVFSDCDNLVSITINSDFPDGIHRNQAFGRTQFRNVTYGEGVTIVRYFIGGRPLESVTLPSTLKIIEDNAFGGNKLTSLIIPR